LSTDELRELAGDRRRQEPYRYLMKNCAQLMATQAWLEARLKGQAAETGRPAQPERTALGAAVRLL
jgi:phosphoenolpyruvate carboxylase